MPEFYMILVRKIPEFYIIIARKISRLFGWGGGEVGGTCPPIPTPMPMNLLL